MSELALAEYLGVSARTIRNQKKKGFEPVRMGDKAINVEKSAHAYVRFLSEQIKQLSAQKSRGNSGNSNDPESDEEGRPDWKAEKEKQGALKIYYENQQTVGDLLPTAALLELVNVPLNLFRTKLLGISNDIEKRVELKPDQKKAIDELVRDALRRLDERSAEELQENIEEVISRYSEHYHPAFEDGDYSVDDGE